MKFEIDEKGMIRTFAPKDGTEESPTWFETTGPNTLEQILQAVKKTQTKLINREIQSVQDSKGRGVSDIDQHILQIEQNQKIVDNIRKYHNLNDSPQNKVLSDCLNHIVKEAIHKDIKDL